MECMSSHLLGPTIYNEIAAFTLKFPYSLFFLLILLYKTFSDHFLLLKLQHLHFVYFEVKYFLKFIFPIFSCLFAGKIQSFVKCFTFENLVKQFYKHTVASHPPFGHQVTSSVVGYIAPMVGDSAPETDASGLVSSDFTL